MDKINLVFPTLALKEQALAYRQEHFDRGESVIYGDGGLDMATSYEEWFQRVTDDLTGTNLPERRVPATLFFGVRASDGRIVGTLQIRHTLNEFLINFGGNIGYGVRPTERRKGYATQMLTKALEECRRLGLEKVLITCNASNLASERTIVGAGGVFEDIRKEPDGTPIKRFWIKL